VQLNELDQTTLRALAEVQLDSGRVLSVYLNLEPSEFATPPARATAIRALLDDAERKARLEDGLSHEERNVLRDDIERVRGFMESTELPVRGAHALAIFCSGKAGLFEVIKLPRPVPSDVVLSRSPFIEPLVEVSAPGRWCVLLVNRRLARIFRGSAERLLETARVTDDVHGQHDQGGWSQARYQRSVEKEATDHVKRSAEVLFQRFNRRPFDSLLVGGPKELMPRVEAELHPYLRERLAGHFEVDVESSTPEQVRAAAEPLIEERERRREREALDRLVEGMGARGRAASGLDEVLGALNGRRVESLLLEDGFSAQGVVCDSCGWIGATEATRCPVDEGTLERRDDITEAAVELALVQSADVLVIRHHEDLGPLGGIGAILRF
jgi:peptide chain release factor subunit 1